MICAEKSTNLFQQTDAKSQGIVLNVKFEHESYNFPEKITCTLCGESSAYQDFSAVIFCNQCRTKLKVPLDITGESGLTCPKCGEPISVDTPAIDGNRNTLFSGANVTVSSSKRMLSDGDIFDKYKIIKLRGSGGMAEVFLAEHLLLKQNCALKLMRSNSVF